MSTKQSTYKTPSNKSPFLDTSGNQPETTTRILAGLDDISHPYAIYELLQIKGL